MLESFAIPLNFAELNDNEQITKPPLKSQRQSNNLSHSLPGNCRIWNSLYMIGLGVQEFPLVGIALHCNQNLLNDDLLLVNFTIFQILE